MNEDIKNLTFVEKYRPETIEQCILPDRLKSVFRGFIAQGDFPNLLFFGTPGVGKTSVAWALAHDMDMEVYYINASTEGNIDTIRYEVREFASKMSFKGRRKVVILDEFDGSSNAAQGALRGVYEEFKKVRFIITCNNKNKIIGPIAESRVSPIEFKVLPDESQELIMQTVKRVAEILDLETIKYDLRVIVELVKKYHPDIRRVLNELQTYAQGGEIDEHILSKTADIDEVIGYLKAGKMDKIREWIVNNQDVDPHQFLWDLYMKLNYMVGKDYVPQVISIIGDAYRAYPGLPKQDLNYLMMFNDILDKVNFQ